ncbi:hypothetical protein MFLO_08772 [Listeria floridensis FSL S10-1187]|uniref:Alpha/beta hydrolase n=1 Tax=Listeria floridensis FSL S10-1187 TaxID=1265817 RepID=A0ABP3AXP7_9LIST|nr:alpha/beta hydrolase [Listeria floridensis]EUJ31510.1 hypothetical protein MFLO_08772 [Listeria floridensis FSL S10-1187]
MYSHLKKKKTNRKKNAEIVPPTIFVHGYAGTKNSLGKMMSRFREADGATKTLVITVKSDGTLDISGRFSKFSRKPMIQVLFEDNKSSMQNQTEWLKTVAKTLKREYHISKIYAVGHSMGGVSLTNYLEQAGSDKSYPQVEKLVLIGAPLNGLAIGDSAYELADNGPKTESERYENLFKERAKISKAVKVYTIAGDLKDGTKSDGSVPLASALSAKFIFDGVSSYKDKVFTGKTAGHSDLHENTAVDQVIAEFLWE